MIKDHKFIQRHGFTLIEVLLGVLMLSFISVCVYGTFKVGIDLSVRFGSQKNIFRQAQLVMGRFAQDIETAVSYDFAGSYPEHIAFDGKSDALVFVARSQGKLRVIAYYLAVPDKTDIKRTVVGNHYRRNVTVTQSKQEAAVALALIREEMDFIDYISSGLRMSGIKEIMMQNISEGGGKFSYAGGATNNGTVVWRPDWKESDLPVTVRMNFALIDNSDKNAQTISFDKSALIPREVSFESRQ